MLRLSYLLGVWVIILLIGMPFSGVSQLRTRPDGKPCKGPNCDPNARYKRYKRFLFISSYAPKPYKQKNIPVQTKPYVVKKPSHQPVSIRPYALKMQEHRRYVQYKPYTLKGQKRLNSTRLRNSNYRVYRQTHRTNYYNARPFGGINILHKNRQYVRFRPNQLNHRALTRAGQRYNRISHPSLGNVSQPRLQIFHRNYSKVALPTRTYISHRNDYQKFTQGSYRVGHRNGFQNYNSPRFFMRHQNGHQRYSSPTYGLKRRDFQQFSYPRLAIRRNNLQGVSSPRLIVGHNRNYQRYNSYRIIIGHRNFEKFGYPRLALARRDFQRYTQPRLQVLHKNLHGYPQIRLQVLHRNLQSNCYPKLRIAHQPVPQFCAPKLLIKHSWVHNNCYPKLRIPHKSFENMCYPKLRIQHQNLGSVCYQPKIRYRRFDFNRVACYPKLQIRHQDLSQVCLPKLRIRHKDLSQVCYQPKIRYQRTDFNKFPCYPKLQIKHKDFNQFSCGMPQIAHRPFGSYKVACDPNILSPTTNMERIGKEVKYLFTNHRKHCKLQAIHSGVSVGSIVETKVWKKVVVADYIVRKKRLRFVRYTDGDSLNGHIVHKPIPSVRNIVVWVPKKGGMRKPNGIPNFKKVRLTVNETKEIMIQNLLIRDKVNWLVQMYPEERMNLEVLKKKYNWKPLQRGVRAPKPDSPVPSTE